VQREDFGGAGLLAKEAVLFLGHPLISATHPTTIELTREAHLTKKGDCIIGVSADKGAAGLSADFRRAIRTDSAKLRVTVRVGDDSFRFRARGSSGLTLTDPNEMVIRKSEFLSPRTLAVSARSAAKDVPRAIVRQLGIPGSSGVMELEVF
jgi:hypothetical protein